MLKPFFYLNLLLFPALSYAFFCPSNFNQINFGDTLEQVQGLCGPAAKQETKEITPAPTEAKGPQEWNYYIPRAYVLSATNQPQMTLKTQIVFDENGKAVNINVNGLSMPSTNVCGAVIQLGSTQDAVKAACGNPSFVNQGAQPATATAVTPSTPPQVQKTKITELTYNSTPPVTLTFENGILKEKK